MSRETLICTIRHAQTAYGAEKRYAGTIDVPLNQTGIDEARRASAMFLGTKFDVVVTSNLIRSIETARLLVGDSLPFVQTRLCNERNFGIIQGLTWVEVQDLEPKILFIKVGGDLHSVNPKGAEPFEDLWLRSKKFKRFLFKEYMGLKILVVSHGVFLQMFHGVFRGLSCIESLAVYPSNLELNIFKYSGNTLVEEKTIKFNNTVEEQW